MKRKRDEYDVALEEMFAGLVEEGEFEVARRDANGKPIAWRLTDLGRARRQKQVGLH
jgi:hypothetical protein